MLKNKNEAYSKKLFQTIVTSDNISQAYLDLAYVLDRNSKSSKFRGINGLYFDKIESNLPTFLENVQKELINFEFLTPAILHKIPKKNGGVRNIYIYTIADRLKAQAIYRILEPIFEKIYSPFLFSYRKNRSGYFAVRSVARRYMKNNNSDYVLVLDIKSYTEFI